MLSIIGPTRVRGYLRVARITFTTRSNILADDRHSLQSRFNAVTDMIDDQTGDNRLPNKLRRTSFIADVDI